MKVFAFLLVIGLVSAFTEVEYKDAFVDWMHGFGKVYAADEFQKRFQAFKDNMDFVREWNAAGHSHTVELNFLADLSNEEYQQIYLGTKFDTETTIRVEMDMHVMSGQPLNDTVDWRQKGAVTPIKNQAQCGSCWAFSTTGSIEGAHQIATGTLVSLSEQNLMDCSTAYGNHACNGGLMDNAFKYVIANHGIDTEDSYPYTMKTQTCQFSTANVGATISSYKDIPSNNEQALADAIQSVGPISVAIDAAHNSFQLYKAGVYYEKQCSATRLDHGVLAVGFGTDASGEDYYIVKNSWGTTWGMQGFINMSRNKQNNCGIATMASYPVV